MRFCWALVALGLLAGCSNGDGGPSLKAFSESNGVLHVEGAGWTDCARVTVALPQPWGARSEQPVADGSFSLMYAHPLVKPYEGTVTATCNESPKDVATAEIRVGDSRVK
jgi:hypothetical protein